METTGREGQTCREDVHQMCGEGRKQTGFGWRKERCQLADNPLLQNTPITLQACSLSLVLGSTCFLGSGSWGPSLLGSSLTSLRHSDVAAYSSEVDLWVSKSLSDPIPNPIPLFLLTMAQLSTGLSYLHSHPLSSPGPGFWASGVIFSPFSTFKLNMKNQLRWENYAKPDWKRPLFHIEARTKVLLPFVFCR